MAVFRTLRIQYFGQSELRRELGYGRPIIGKNILTYFRPKPAKAMPKEIHHLASTTTLQSYFTLTRHLYNCPRLLVSWPKTYKFIYTNTNAKTTYDSFVTESGTTLYFDTHKLVKKLQLSGFTQEQAEVVTGALIEIMSGSAGAVSKSMVTRNELAQMEMRISGAIEALRKDMVILEKSEFLMLKHESENLKIEVQQMSRLHKDELLKLKGGLTLDLSLEKGRHKEDFTLQDQKIRDTHNRIDTEIARIRTDLEAQKLDLIKYLVGCFLSVVTVMIGIWRFVKM